MKTSYDVIIVGAGSMGISAAYFLAKKGIKPLVLDAFDPPHTRGSHHGDTRLFRYAYTEAEPYVPLAIRSHHLWKELEEESSTSIFHETGVLSVGIDNHPSIGAKIKAAQAYSLPFEAFSAEDLHRRWPQLQLPESSIGIFETKAGVLFSEQAILAYRRLAEQKGTEIKLYTPVEQIRIHPNGVEVRTKEAVYRADKAIVCGGAWNSQLLPDLRLPLRVIRKTVGWFECRETLYRSVQFPGFVFSKGTSDYYGFPDFDGSGVKVGRHDQGYPVHPDEPIPPFGRYEEDERDLREFLQSYMPGAAGRLMKGATCLYTMTPDEDFIVDRHPAFPHVVIAAGFSGHGFKFASAIGEVLSQWILEERTAIDLSRFSLKRKALARTPF